MESHTAYDSGPFYEFNFMTKAPFKNKVQTVLI